MRVALLLLIAGALLWGCASAPAARKPDPAETRLEISPEVKAQMERNAKKVQQKEELFEVFSRKSDEYQNLFGVCQDLSDKEQNKALKEACSAMLGDMRRELAVLKGRLEEQ